MHSESANPQSIPAEVHPSLLQRKIIHFDMDAFYAAVEIRDDPKLGLKPLVIGGSPQSRGVVCTASYIARKFGVRSAMSCAQAARLCPEAVFIEPNFAKYQAASQEILRIFREYTSTIEPLSLDEAYLDVTNNSRGLYAVRIARLVQEQIRDELQLSGSAGVAPNKLLAKIASDIHKPFGLTVILPDQVRRFMADLELRRIHGIGPASEKRLQALGLHCCRDVWKADPLDLEKALGSMGRWLWQRAQGLDERPVEIERQRKSLGKEDTFASDILDLTLLRGKIQELSGQVALGLQTRGLLAKTVTLKCKYSDFTQVTRSRSLAEATADASQITDVALSLLRETAAGQSKVRLLGVSVANFGGQTGLRPLAFTESD